MQIDQELRYKTGKETYPDWIRKIAKTGNLFVNYYIDKAWGAYSHYSTTRAKWVKPTEEMEDGFIIVKDLPKKPFKPKPKTCQKCAVWRSDFVDGVEPCTAAGCNKEDKHAWVEYIGYDDGSQYDNSPEAWEIFIKTGETLLKKGVI